MSTRSLVALLMFLVLGATALAPASAGAATEERRSQQAITKINYPGYGIQVVRLSGDQKLLKGTPGSLKRFVKARLNVLFEEAGSKPRCATSPTVVVDRYDSHGWARVGEGWYAPCPAGGYDAIYDKTSSGWRQILGAQDVRYCQDLAWYGVPRFIAGGRCLTEANAPVRYTSNDDTTTSPEATARRAAWITNGVTTLPAQHIALPAVLEQLQVVVTKGGYLTVADCVAAGDGSALSAHLGDAPFGCAATATYEHGKKQTTESLVLRMMPSGDDILVTELYPVV